MTYPKVSIIILNWNGLEDTIECLESLKTITYPNYEVIVVDNGSRGDDVKVLRERYRDYVEIVENESNLGFAKGNNVGIRYALDKGTDYVLLLNNDTVVASDFLDEMVRVAESDVRIGIVCPRMYQYTEPEKVCFDGGERIRLWWGTRTGGLPPNDERAVVDTEFAVGAGMLIRRGTVAEIGLLPEEYFFGGEDVDYSLQTLRRNLRIVVARKAHVWHKLSSAAVSSLQWEGIGEHLHLGWQMLRRKYLSPPGYVLATAFGLVRYALVALRMLLSAVWHRDFRRARSVLQYVVGALQGTAKAVFKGKCAA